MSDKQFEGIPFLNEEEGLSEQGDLPVDKNRYQKKSYRISKIILYSLFLVAILIITAISIATQKILTTNTRGEHPNNSQNSDSFDLSLDAKLAPNRLNPDLYEFPRLGNVVAKTEGCGTSPEEAKALGCIFDPMNWHWTRPECFYEEGSKNAQAQGPWKYFRDANHTEEMYLADEQAMSTERLMYTEHSWHVNHCIYALESMHRAAMLDKWIPEEAASWPHTLHCMMVFRMMNTPPKKPNTRVDMQFLGCVKFEHS
ncbi:hypothetical protein TMatcc_008968 [Talaromyces marneffei ATCC 18224]|uniref:Uncharacterized protein n=2 Tax=Talaromyces marneffei TaxID=37727 RepID=B6QKI1_TALMQ|nr:uncharacterized protein EYB26_008274 [Talaromyces marneffei]EEA21608.1 conserved hypothetical protein [Talaromyces marneffei ATCC 18224]KAE8550903.1 hypothetical protein EYB25_007135 [Talaromyces marneffei]QGA20568.1 hypothetical protein EYB26_008274 [Talaromyces marneffei]